MSKIILQESYDKQQTNEEIMNQFILRLVGFYGGLGVVKRKTLKKNDQIQEEFLSLSNGYQFNLMLVRTNDPEVSCRAVHAFNLDYISKLTEEDYKRLLTLAVKRSFEVTTIPNVTQPLDSYEEKEAEYLSFLIPKLMIICGQGTEDNFSSGVQLKHVQGIEKC